MAQQTIETTDSLNQGREKINENFTELYGPTYTDYVPVFTGFSANPNPVTARYIKTGKMVHIYVTMGNGTSNATTKTITLPFAAANTLSQRGCLTGIVNGGTGQTNIGQIATRVNSDVADIYLTQTATAWTGSGTCKFDISFTYESV